MHEIEDFIVLNHENEYAVIGKAEEKRWKTCLKLKRLSTLWRLNKKSKRTSNLCHLTRFYQPKISSTIFSIFLDEFKKSFKEDHPKDKWKDMSEVEKVFYLAKAQ